VPTQVRDRVTDHLGTVDQAAEQDERDRHHQRRPHRHREAGPHAGSTSDHVAEPPAQSTTEAEQQRAQGDVPSPAEADHGESGRPEEDAQELASARSFSDPGRCDQHGEQDLRLQHQRCQARRHPGVHRGVEQPELAQGHEQAHSEHGPPGSLGTRHEERRRHQHSSEAERDEGQWRHPGRVVESPLDDDEVETPDRGDEDGEKGMARTHATSVAAHHHVAPAMACE
jgi:hypothetical protein